MIVVADTHLHLYPCYDSAAFFDRLRRNLLGYRADARAALLAERFDCDAFGELEAGRLRTGSASVRETGESGALLVRWNGDGVFLFAGRQIVTAERIEVLAAVTASRIADGAPAAETVQAVIDGGGVPIVSWAPGKWFGRRGAIVAALLDRFSPGQLLLGDSTLRPTVWPTPRLMRAARRRGFPVVAGSDPLPFRGEERFAGAYASRIEGAFDPNRPVSSMRQLLRAGAVGAVLGRRCGPLEVLGRLRRHKR